MPITVTMPPVSEAAIEVTVGVWLHQVGEVVAEGEPLLEVVSDKVTIEVPAPASGTLSAIVVAEGETVAVGATIATIALPGEATIDGHPAADSPPQSVASSAAPVVAGNGSAEPEGTGAAPLAAPGPMQPAPARSAPSELASPLAGAVPTAGPTAGPAGTVPVNGGTRRLITPRVRQLAAEHGLDEPELAGLHGSGLGGRLTSADLLAYLAQHPVRPTAMMAARPALSSAAPAVVAPAIAPPTGAAPAPLAPHQTDLAGGETLQPLTPIRRAIAAHMERSVRTAPHGWMSLEIDMSAVTRARGEARAAFEAAEGFSLTYLPFFAAAVVAALRAEPALNAIWVDDDLQRRAEINLGVAVAIDDGLVVPVVTGADGLNLTGLARAIRDKVERARANRLTPGDITNGTCTINNTGAVGSILSRPIINQPQVAIVTMEAIVRRPVVVGEDAIAIRPLMNACLSYDERAVNAAQAARLLAEVRARLEGWSAG